MGRSKRSKKRKKSDNCGLFRKITLRHTSEDENYLHGDDPGFSDHDHLRIRRTLILLAEANKALLRVADEQSFLGDLCSLVVDKGGYLMSWVGYAEHDPCKSITPVAQHGFEQSYLDALALTWADAERGRGPTGTAIRTGKPVVVQNILRDPTFLPWRAAAIKRGYASSASFPLIVEGTVLGAINVYAREPNAFDWPEVELLMSLANDIAFGLIMLRDRAAKQIAEAEREQLVMAIDSTADMVVLVDREGAITYVNKAFEKLTGYCSSETLGRSALNMFTRSEQYSNSSDDMLAVINTGDTWRGKMTNRTKWGDLLQVECSVAPLRKDDGNVLGYVAVYRDTTRETELERQFYESQKMEAMGQLASGVAHDFNNVLLAMTGYISMAIEDSPPGGVVRESLEEVMQAGARAKRMIHQILAFSRKSVSERHPLDIRDIISETLRLVSVSLPQDIDVQQNIDAAPAMVLADSTQIHQVLMNLYANAVHAIGPKQGVMTVGVDMVHTGPERDDIPPDLVDGAYVCVSVSDSGEGMSDEVKKRIFEPFFTTKPAGVGTGMGLAAVQGIVASHDGAITTESKQGKGTSFVIWLPRISEKNQQP